MALKKRLLFVDGNWILHRVFYTLKTSRPIEEVLPRNFLGLVMKDACAVRATHVLVAFDGNDIFRYKLYDQYKANRSDKENEKPKRMADDEEGGGVQDIYSYLPAVRKLMEKCGLILVSHKHYEADDFWASAAVQYSEQGMIVIGAGKDKDGYQVLSDTVKMYDSSHKPEPRWITKEKAEKSKGVPIAKMIMYQTLLGDKIDNIPQLMSPAKAKSACLKYGSIKEMFEKGDPETRKLLRAKQAQIRINRQLVSLKTDLALPDLEVLKPSKIQLDDMPTSWYAHQDLCWPKSKGLFGKR